MIWADIVVAIFNLRDRLNVMVHTCSCGSNDLDIVRERGKYYVYCVTGCRHRGVPSRFKRRAKINWNKGLKCNTQS